MTQKIRYANPGDRLSARYINRIVDGANLAINLLGPAKSTRLPSADSYTPPLDENDNGVVNGVGTRIYRETARRTSSVRVSDPNDSSVYVDVDRIDEVTLQTGAGETITLVFRNA